MKTNSRADLSINKYKIDKELLEQAQKYYDWAQLAAEAEVEKDKAKDAYDLIVIEVEKKIRKKGDKTTEGAIKSEVASNQRVKIALKRFNKARNNYKLIYKAEKAFEQRKRMLESYLYHIHREKNSEVRVPREYEKQFNRQTRKQIEEELNQKHSIRRR